ncbi:hypothetical protein B0H10DRAFT_1939453 [Mycena sp. CBHHK59/15]|nr:hypothetical protein B0H10DRAFT_1939453 [Mycena sp. CBHHK59/15]
MSLFSLSSTAGPSETTLQALSEYCSSSDSPTSGLGFDSDSDSLSIVSSNAHPVSSVSFPNLVPELPQIIMQSSRFRSASVQEKMLKALKSTTGSGFTRQAPTEDPIASLGSTQAICDGVCGSISEYPVFDVESVIQSSTPTRIGLGLFVPSETSASFFIPACAPISSLSTTTGITDTLSTRLMLSPPLTPTPDERGHLEMPSNADPAQSLTEGNSSSIKYAGLGHGLPSHMRSVGVASGFTIPSIRSISQLLGVIPSSSFAVLNAMPALTRCSRIEPTGFQPQKALNRLRNRARDFIRMTLHKLSFVHRPPEETQQFELRKAGEGA